MAQQQTILKDDKLTFGVTDPSDWNSTRLPIVSLLDSALRCQICKDYYDTPVITKCSHTFCSRCIRRSLGAEQKCPMCRAAAQEIQLRRNGAAQELVDAFAAARPMLMQVATELVRKGDGAAAAEVSNCGAQQPEAVRISGPVVRGGGGPERRVTRASSRPQSQQKQQPSPPPQAIVVSEEDDDEYKPSLPPPGMVACPICDQHVREKRINLHIDKGCPREQSPPIPKRLKYTNSFFGSRGGHQSSGPSVAAQSSELTIPPLRPLPKIAFGLIKEPALRNKLHELGLPSHGTKKNLQDRYNEWLTLWNANADSSRPRSKRELLMELHSWEAANSIPAVERTKVPGWSDQKWGNDHKDHFRDLIENAKRRRPKKLVEEPVPEDVEDMVEVPPDPSVVTTDAGSGALQPTTTTTTTTTTTITTTSPGIHPTVEQLEPAGAVNYDTFAIGAPLELDPIGIGGPVVPGIIPEPGAELMLEDQNLLAPYGKRKFEEIEGGAASSGIHGL